MASIDYQSKILNLEKYNGRVNIVEPENPFVILQMQERLASRNKPTEYRDAMIGVWEDNLLSQAFFSEKNIQIIQNGIRAGVHKMSGEKFIIPPQNIDSLKIVMRGTFLQHAQYSQKESVADQVAKLNRLVFEYAVPTGYNEAVAYVKYCQDQSTLVMPLSNPMRPDRDYKQLQLKDWV